MKMKAGRNSNVGNDDGIDSISGGGGKSAGNSASSSGTRRGSRENRELYAELKMKADKLEKEFEEHKRRISHDRSDSGRWSKVPVEEDEEKKGGDCSGGNSLRGELYDKYMEKRVARLRTEQGSKRAAMNEVKLRAMRDDLERWRGELQRKVMLPEEAKISGARQRLQKFRSFNVQSSLTSEEREIDIRRLEEDEDLMKFFRQKSTRTEQSESEASKRDDALQISRSYEPKKDFPVRNPSSSSVARAVAPPIPRPMNKLIGYSSARPKAKPEKPLDFRKENTKPPSAIGRKANQSITKNIVRTRIVSEDPQKLQSAKKSSASPLGSKNSLERNAASGKATVRKMENLSFDKRYSISFVSEPLLRKAKPRAFAYELRNGKSHHNLSSDMDELADIAKVDILSMTFEEEEGDQDLLEKFSKSVDLDPFLGNACTQNPRNVASFNPQNKQDNSNLMVATDDAGNTGKISCFILRNDEDDLGDSTIAAKDLRDSVMDRTHDDRSGVEVVERRTSRESDESGNFESSGGDSSGSQSRIELSIDSTSELTNFSDLKNSEPVSVENPNGISTTQETTPAIVDVISYKADADQIRRDIENPPNSVPPTNYSLGRSRKGILKGFKRFLILSKRSRGDESSADWLSTTTSEGDDEIFSESIVLEEQVRSLHFPVPAPSDRIKHKGGYASERSLKATRSFFSLSSFRCKGDDSKPK